MRTAIWTKMKRTLAMVLSLVLVFSVLPSSKMAYAATEGHPNTVTITVVNEQGEPIEGATVTINVDSVSNGNASASNNDPFISGDKITDVNGVVEIMASEAFIPNDMTLSATVTANGYFGEVMEETAISEAEQNFVIMLESVAIEGKSDLVYTVDEDGPVAQKAVSVDAQDGDTVTYKIDGVSVLGEAKVTDVKMVDGKVEPYKIEVTVKREGYGDLVKIVDTTVNPAEQSLVFSNEKYINGGETSVTVSEGDASKYDFSAQDEKKLAGGKITYAIQAASGNASVDAKGQLTVNGPGVVTVLATLSSNNKNYKACTICHTLEVYNIGEFISFKNEEVNYVLGTSDIIAEQQATLESGVTGNITYAMESTPGISLGNENGNWIVKVVDYKALAEAIQDKDGCLKVIVTATKAADGSYGKDVAWYKVKISFGEKPENAYTLPDPKGTEGWYNEAVKVTPIDDYKIAQEISSNLGEFDDTITFSEEGEGERYVYLRNRDTGAITDKIGIELKIDTTSPEVKMEYVRDRDKEIQKTIFTVKEHNFRAKDVVVTGTKTDINEKDKEDIELTDLLKNATWVESETEEDTYTCEYDGYQDGIYNLSMNYTDVANNSAIKLSEAKFSIDHAGPDKVSIKIIGEQKSLLENVKKALSFGFYKEEVTVKFTAYDNVAGVKNFYWKYNQQEGTSASNRPTDKEFSKVVTKEIVQDKTDKSLYTATITLPNTSEKQLRGYLEVYAVDKFDNKSEIVTDDNHIIIVDKIAPKVTVAYDKANSWDDEDKKKKKAYYNTNVTATIRVEEANFYAEDVVVKVSKDGGDAKAVTLKWNGKNDVYNSSFTLKKDGHYIITVDYKDKSQNKSTYTSHEIIIDRDKPLVEVTYSNGAMGKSESGCKYYSTTQSAVVKITEPNFRADDVKFRITAKDVTGRTLDASAVHTKSKWTTDKTGDVHTMTITYPGDANYVFDIDYTDLPGNAADNYAEDYFTVDKAKPTNMTVSYSTGVLETVLENITFGFYNAKMTVTLTAEDAISGVRGFNYSYAKAVGVSGVNAELINQKVSEGSIKYSDEGRKATVSFDIPKDALGSDSQFNGTVSFSAEDNAGNATGTYQETRRIVVDNIAPAVQVNYNNPVNTVDDVSYYDGNINATVVITEANFYPEDVQIMVSKDDGAETEVTASWVDGSTDIHEGTFTLTEQGEYFITVNYKDKSSNEMTAYTSNRMIIDTAIDEIPTFKINGTEKAEEGGAYKGEVNVEFGYGDVNFDSKTITFTRTRFDKTEDVTDLIQFDNPERGGSFTIPANVIENDGIYDLTVNITDKAGHEEESHIRFTVNRYGSVYEYGNYLASLIKDGMQYFKIEGDNNAAITEDLVITEYNAGRINDNSLKILITRDGEPLDIVDYTTNPENINSQVEVSENGWYQYVYNIKASNFKEDGVYKITLASEYSTDDVEGNNESVSVPENSVDAEGNQILDTMSFVVDTEKPEIRNIVNLDETSVNATQIDVQYTIVDVGGLKSVEIILNGETVDTVTEFGDDVFNYSGTFPIAEKDKAQTVQIKVTDLAGNVTDTAEKDFDTKGVYVFNDTIVVTTNDWVRWYENKPFFFGTIGGVIVLVGGACSIFVFRRRKKLKV